jgi:hypothetical protein
MTLRQSAAARSHDPTQEHHQFEFEHNRLSDALERTAQVAELAGHDVLAAALRRDRAEIVIEVVAGNCEELQAFRRADIRFRPAVRSSSRSPSSRDRRSPG